MEMMPFSGVLFTWPVPTAAMAGFCVAAAAALWMLFTTLGRLRKISRRLIEDDFGNCPGNLPPVSVIVWSESSRAGLTELVASLYEQEYPTEFEVIVVNCCGEEWVEETVKMLGARFPQLRSTFVPPHSRNLSRRKLAITLGVKAARHEVVLLTEGACKPSDRLWLAAMTRNFMYGADIVAGRTALRDSRGNDTLGAMRSFDCMLMALRCIPAVIKGRPVGVDAGNLAFRKSLFFDLKGFSSSLNLNYGHDDIFIAELAERGEIAAELSASSIIEERVHNPKEYYDLERTSRRFTGKRLRRLPFYISRSDMAAAWVWLAGSITAGVCALPSLTGWAAAAILGTALWWPLCACWGRAAEGLRLRPRRGILPALWLGWALYALHLKLFSRKHRRNYTWQ